MIIIYRTVNVLLRVLGGITRGAETRVNAVAPLCPRGTCAPLGLNSSV